MGKTSEKIKIFKSFGCLKGDKTETYFHKLDFVQKKKKKTSK